MSQIQHPALSLPLLQRSSSSVIQVINRQSYHQPPTRRYCSTSYPLAATTLLLLLLLPAPAVTQSPIDNGCLALSSSKACRGFKDYYVGVPALARYGLNTTFDSIDAFDQAIDGYTTSTRSYIASLECYSASDLASINDNSTTDFPYARYSKSRICAALVQDSDSSLPCNYNRSVAPLPLCKSTCQQWISSVNTTIHNTDLNICPNVNQPQVSTDLQFLVGSCNDWGGFNGAAGSCINGTQNEPTNCGFSNTTNDACTYCQQNSTDPCCQDLTSCSSRSLSIGAIIGIVIGAVVGLVLAGLGFFFCCKRQNKRVRKENSFSFKTYIAPLTQQQRQNQRQQHVMGDEGDHYSGNKVLLQEDYYGNRGDNHPSSGMMGTMTTQTTGHRSQLSDPFGDHYEVISLANNPPTTTTPNSNHSTLVPGAATKSADVILPLVALDDPHSQDESESAQIGGATITGDDKPAYEEEFYQVVHPYPPQVADELGLQVGDIVCLAMGFDDGWALGFNVTTGSKGVFPLVCVSLIPPSVLEQLLTNSSSNNHGNSIEDPMVDGLSTFSSKVLVEDDDSTHDQQQYQQLHQEQQQQQQQSMTDQRRLSRSSQLAISIRRIREDMRRSLSISSSTASYHRHPSPLSATNSISSRSIRPSSPSPSQLSQHHQGVTADIPRRTASMVRSNNNNNNNNNNTTTIPSAATIEYAECDSPTSPTHQTPLFHDTNHHLHQQQHLESFEMSHHQYNHNRISKQES